MIDRRMPVMPEVEREYKLFEQHGAESKWQYCNCQSCQDKRMKLESLPGEAIDWNKFRLKDEKY